MTEQNTTSLKAADLEVGMTLVAVAPEASGQKWHQAGNDPIAALEWNNDTRTVRTESGSTWNLPADRRVLIVTPDEDADPETVFLSRAAAHVVEANAVLWTDPTSANIARARVLGAMWEDLTGLTGLDAQDYAKRLVESGEVTAHVAPF